MARQATGLVYSSKNPNPKKSSKSFVWPAREVATEAVKQALAGSLQELLTKKGWKHTDLAEKLFGFDDSGVQRKLANVRQWIRGTGPFPQEDEAGFTAELLEVSLERLLNPKEKFDPNHPMIRPKSKHGEGEYSRSHKKKVHVDPDDKRWVLPTGAPPPVLKMNTDPEHEGMMSVEFIGVIPQDVALAFVDMVAYRRESPKE